MEVLDIRVVSQEFTLVEDGSLGGAWQCVNGHTIRGAILLFYRTFGSAALKGRTYLGLPTSDELPMANYPGVAVQTFTNALVCHDPSHHFRPTVGAGDVYLLPLELITASHSESYVASLKEAMHRVYLAAQAFEEEQDTWLLKAIRSQ
jgi:hypothetical protein